MILLAYERGYLKHITTPIHKFLITNKHKIRKNYLTELTEFWMTKYQLPEKRFEKSKSSFHGRISELILADWIDEHNYSIINLEVWGADIDIIAQNNQGKIFNFEVKYIGHEEWFFDKLIGKNNDCSPNLYYQHDYVLYIAYTAVKQLEKINGNRIGAILIQNWNHYDENWIDWNNPDFHEIKPKWKEKYPNIEKEICTIFNQINELWFFEIDEAFKCHCKQKNIKQSNTWQKTII